MFAKMVAFVLLSIGALVALGGIAAAAGPTIQKVAIHTGDAGGGFTWFHITAAAMGCLVCWLVSKV